MKKIYLFLTATLLLVANDLIAQKNHNGFSVGMQVGQYQKDFGMGLNITSPFIAEESLAFRFRANLVYNEIVENGKTIWTPYTNFSVGLIGVSGMLSKHIRLYGEGGVLGIIPSNKISSKNFAVGGYGLFGFEFFHQSPSSYFIEIGGLGAGTAADKIANSPIYSNGLLISAGYKVYFKKKIKKVHNEDNQE